MRQSLMKPPPPRPRPSAANVRKARRATVDRRTPPIGNPGSRGKPMATYGNGFQPNIRLQAPDLSGIGQGVGDFIRQNNPIDKLYDVIGKRLKNPSGR